MISADPDYDPCCASCAWADEIYTGTFSWRLFCFLNPQRIKPTTKDKVCKYYEQEKEK